MQAILSRYHGPGNVRGSRITAQCQAKRITVEYDDALNLDDNHRAAATKLILALGWHGHWCQGTIPSGDYVAVCAKWLNGLTEGFDVWEGMTL